MSYTLLGEEYVEVEPELRVNRLQACEMEGQHPWRVDLLERFGCKIVAVARSGEVLVNFEDDFLIQNDDQIFLCGSPQSIDSYLQIFPQPEVCTPDEVP